MFSDRKLSEIHKQSKMKYNQNDINIERKNINLHDEIEKIKIALKLLISESQMK
jgi:hypothetical protein